jgi:para-nitrobenzyl esterase
LGATHCCEPPFLFNTFDTYPDSLMLGKAGDAECVLGHLFASAVAEFVATGSVNDWPPYATGHIRHFI